MSKYIKVFDTVEEYNNYSGGTGFVTPNISYVKGNDKSYYDNNEIKHYTPESWVKIIDKAEYTANTIGNQENYNLWGINSLIKEIEIPNNITSFGENAFFNCKSLENINIPSGVTSIGGACFGYCTSLKSVSLPYGITSLPSGRFRIGNDIYNGVGTFENCTSLSSITIPNSVTTIENGCFSRCSSLTSVNIPSGVTTINETVFFNCNSLTSIDIPNSVTSIGNNAFQNCTSLTSIDIPSGVTSIGNEAFHNCSGLTSITVNSINPPTLSSNAFYKSNCPINVPSQSVETYKAATNWSAYADRIQAIPNN